MSRHYQPLLATICVLLLLVLAAKFNRLPHSALHFALKSKLIPASSQPIDVQPASAVPSSAGSDWKWGWSRGQRPTTGTLWLPSDLAGEPLSAREGAIEQVAEGWRALSELDPACFPDLESSAVADTAAVAQTLQEQAAAVLDIYRRAGCLDWVREFGERPEELCSAWPGVLCGNGTLLAAVDESTQTGALIREVNVTVTNAVAAWHVTGVALHGLVSNWTTPFRWDDPNSVRYAMAQVVGGAPLTAKVHRTTCLVNMTGPLDTADLAPLKELRLFVTKRLNMTGAFPAQLTQMCKMNYLTVSDELMGPIPDSLRNLQQLEVFNIGGNRLVGDSNGGFNGSFPAALPGISTLREVHLSNNSFTGPIPDDFFRLPNLVVFKARANYFSGPIPDSIGEAQKLTSLDLQLNSLSGPLPDTIGDLPVLTDLILSLNNFSGPLPQALGRLLTLQRLNVEGTPPLGSSLTGALPDLTNLTKLTVLKLAYNQLTGPLPSWIGSLPRLNKVSLDHNRFSGQFFVPVNTQVECTVTAADGSNGQVANFGWNFFNSTAAGAFTPDANSPCPQQFADIWVSNLPGNCFYNLPENDAGLSADLRARLQTTSRPQTECEAFYTELSGGKAGVQGDSSRSKSGHSRRRPTVVAVVVGTLAGLGVLVAALALFLRYRRGGSRQKNSSDKLQHNWTALP